MVESLERERESKQSLKRESKGNRQERAEAIVGKSKRQEQKQLSERAIVRSRSSKDNIIVEATSKRSRSNSQEQSSRESRSN